MKTDIKTVFISVLLYLIYILGILLLQSDNFRIIVKRCRLKHRLSVKEEKSKLTDMASELLSVATSKNTDGIILIAFEMILFSVSFAVALRTLTLFMSLLLALLLSLLPVAYLYSRKIKVQTKGSREAISLTTELYRQYRICGMNIFDAIEASVNSKGDFPVCKKQLYLLLVKLRECSGIEEIKKCCRQFGRALGSVWGTMLAESIEASACSGTDISVSLADIISQLKDAKQREEEKKRLNSESVRMTVFLVPVLYFSTAVLSVKYLDMSLSDFLHNQFFTAEGLILFMISVILFFFNLIIISVFMGSKLDI